jgi:hypothetical protein
MMGWTTSFRADSVIHEFRVSRHCNTGKMRTSIIRLIAQAPDNKPTTNSKMASLAEETSMITATIAIITRPQIIIVPVTKRLFS